VIGILGALAVTGALLAAGYHFGLARVLGARAASSSSLTDLAPADSDLVLYADLATLRASPLLQPLQSIASNTQQDAEYTAFVRASGFDYERDLDRFVVVSRKKAAGGPNEVIVVGEGRFDQDRIRAYALANGTLEHRGSKEIFLVKSDTQGKIIALTFLSANRIAISDSGNLDAILSPPAAATDATLASRVARVAGAPLFAVWHTPNLRQDFAPGGIQSQQLSDLIRSVRWVGVTVQPMTDRLRLNIEGECETSDQAATFDGALATLRLLADGMLSSQGMKSKTDPQMLSLLRQLLYSAAISHNDRWASLSLDVPEDLLQYAAQHAKQAPTPATPPAPPAPVGGSAPPAAAPPPPPAPQR
jgi:hypothetical protein